VRRKEPVEYSVGEDIYTKGSDSSGDEHVGFSGRTDRLQYGLQKIRDPRPTILSGNFYGSSVSSA